MNAEYGTMNLWTNDLKECKFSLNYGNKEYEKVPGKIFFKIILQGDRVTDVNMDMEVKDVSFHPDGDN